MTNNRENRSLDLTLSALFCLLTFFSVIFLFSLIHNINLDFSCSYKKIQTTVEQIVEKNRVITKDIEELKKEKVLAAKVKNLEPSFEDEIVLLSNNYKYDGNHKNTDMKISKWNEKILDIFSTLDNAKE
jgi:hypothetical protein